MEISLDHGRRRTRWAQIAEIHRQKMIDEEKAVRPKVPGKGECPSCGKTFTRGLNMHVKYCKGE